MDRVDDGRGWRRRQVPEQVAEAQRTGDTRTLAATSTGARLRVESDGPASGPRRRHASRSILDHWRGRRGLFRRRKAGHGSDESVAAAGQRLDEPRHIGRVPERISQPANRGIQAVLEVDECLGRPQSLPQLLAGNELAGTIQQRLEHLKRLFGKTDPDAALPQLAGPQIQLERAKADDGSSGALMAVRSSDTERARDATTPVTPRRICMTA